MPAANRGTLWSKGRPAGSEMVAAKAFRSNGLLLTPTPMRWNHCGGRSFPLVTDPSSHAVILVVDDDVFERMGASGMFVDAGYLVLEAGNADEALQFFETDADIGLLFTDVSMPGSMSGADLARRVAARWPAVGIILASGRPRPDTLPPRMRFHEKPYAPDAVLMQAREMMPLG